MRGLRGGHRGAHEHGGGGVTAPWRDPFIRSAVDEARDAGVVRTVSAFVVFVLGLLALLAITVVADAIVNGRP